MNKIIVDFMLNHPKIVKEMESCSHAYNEEILNPYHIEGSVWTHTMMVCKEMEGIIKRKRVQGEDMIKELMWGALLHDIAKSTTRYANAERQIVLFNGHESLGMFRALDILVKEDSLTDENIKNIVLLVGLHSHLQRNSKEKVEELFKGNERILEKTLLLYEADNNGRYTITPNRDMVENFNVQNKEDYKSKPRTITILVGPPLSGKTRYINELKDRTAVVISKDALLKRHFSKLGDSVKRIKTNFKEGDEKKFAKIVDEEIQKAVKAGRDIYVDANNLTKAEREIFLGAECLAEYGKRAVVLMVGYGELLRRNRTKKRVPNFIIEKECRKFHNPFYDEFDQIEYKIYKGQKNA